MKRVYEHTAYLDRRPADLQKIMIRISLAPKLDDWKSKLTESLNLFMMDNYFMYCCFTS